MHKQSINISNKNTNSYEPFLNEYVHINQKAIRATQFTLSIWAKYDIKSTWFFPFHISTYYGKTMCFYLIKWLKMSSL